VKLNDIKIEETRDLSDMTIDDEVNKVPKKDKLVGVKFSRLCSNFHCTKDVVDSILYLIRFGESRQHFSPYQLGQSLPNEEAEKAAIFNEKFGQPILFTPGDIYQLPESEALNYKEKLGTFKTTYKEGPMFFKTEEEYERALDTKDFVTILEA